MEEPLKLENPTLISKPKRIQLSSSTFLFTISLSLLSFTFLFLSSKDTTFWFLLSNAIIFFVAADSNASSPSKPKSDLYDEYLKIARSRNALDPSIFRPSVSSSSLATIPDGNKEVEAFEHTSENVDSGKAIVAIENKKKTPHESEETHSDSPAASKPKSNLCIEYLKEEEEEEQEKKEASDVHLSGIAKPGEGYRRSESEKAIVAVESKEKVLQRSETGNGDGGGAEDVDFSAMSTEEVNRRAEEFIQRFNRQMRQQGARQRSESEDI